ncbi:two component transcriptional regulator, winged helix family [Rippkaea orientalis PCC 8801]|uniref:Two component transcriptional regulator, winged helix family n=1 Tax=Rippkaea orientalis (strain PCC 8801 / RF-1) TaxID=41431 RepID=B7JZB0_RIPO1|nr:two-component system response regulator RppA [Rippkaea orientalis]ACK67321.1 two component transcriptional regulator, winged helix family [Rippkaea orientalis PCC 8801]
MKILLVDDEPELTEPLTHVLSHEGYEVDVTDNGNIGYELAVNNSYDLLILDWMLPNKPGIEICQALRSQGNTTPVLFLTAKDTLNDRVLGLDAGADDYLVKPFELRELLARVRALLRRSPHLDPTPSTKLKIADLELDRDNQVAYRQGRGVNLSDKEVQLLSYFMENPGQLLTHEQIYQQLWDQTEQPNSNVVAALIRLLRRKIEAEGELPLIHTVYGKGYRFGS